MPTAEDLKQAFETGVGRENVGVKGATDAELISNFSKAPESVQKEVERMEAEDAKRIEEMRKKKKNRREASKTPVKVGEVTSEGQEVEGDDDGGGGSARVAKEKDIAALDMEARSQVENARTGITGDTDESSNAVGVETSSPEMVGERAIAEDLQEKPLVTEKEREEYLLNDLADDLDTYYGGQNVDKRSAAIRLKKMGVGSILTDEKKKDYRTGRQVARVVREFTTQAVGKLAVKAAVWVTARLGWSALSESLNAIIPGGGVILDIIGQIVIWIGEKTLGAIGSQLNELHRAWTGHDFSLKEASVPIIAGGVTLAGLAATSIAGFIAIRRATQIAVVSAVGIIIASVATLLFYVSFSYLVAPVLSTLVQFDSVEKVKYEDYTYISASGDCGWPTSGHYSIVTGPTGGTHYKSKLEAIDIGAPNLSPHLSGTDGVVSFTGVYSNYGNTVVVSTTNDAGSFDVYYGHLAVISVGKGQQVKKGQKIGVVGGSGGWSPHIHMEYKGIKYNECPAGGLQIKVGCCSYSPAPQCTGACNAFSN